MHRGKRNMWFAGGLMGMLLAIIFFGLIWLPAPYVEYKQWQWVDTVNVLYYLLLGIPLSWAMGSLSLWRDSKAETMLAAVILLGAIALFIALLNPISHIVLLAISAAITFCAIWIYYYINNKKSKVTMFLLSYLIVAAIFVYPTSYIVTYPAMTMNMNNYATVSSSDEGNDNTIGQNGWIAGVLVYERPAFLIDWLYAELFPQYELVKKREDEPSVSETYTRVVTMKKNANDIAVAVASEKAKLGAAIHPEGVLIQAVMTNSPAEHTLLAGDIITAINETSVDTPKQLTEYMGQFVNVGDTITLHIKRDGQGLTAQVQTMAREQDDDTPIIGIMIEASYSITIDVDVNYKHYITHFGGPSHGAMLTLALYDQLVEEDITKGLKVAGTGTIEYDGSIGMVGGIPQKAYAVSRTEADVFFVPKDAYEAAKLAAPALNIVAVEHIDDILSWLAQQ